jgi:hypothetical protein
MKTSATRPPGHPNDWPLDDKNAFVALLQGIADKQAVEMGQIAAAHASARELELEGKENHWMVDELLGGCFGGFYVRTSDLYANAQDFLKWAGERDFEHIGSEAVAWARKLALAETDH